MKMSIPIQELTGYTHIASGYAEILTGQLLRQKLLLQQQELEEAIDACLQSLRRFVDLLHKAPPDQIPPNIAAELLSTVTQTLLPRLNQMLEEFERSPLKPHKSLENLHRLTDEVADYFETLEISRDPQLRRALKRTISPLDLSGAQGSRDWRDLLSSL